MRPAPARPAPGPPEPGQAFLEVSSGRVTLFSNGAGQGPLLRRLARAAHFEVVAGQGRRGLSTLRLEEVGLEEALDRLLEGIRYEIHYEVGPGGHGHVLALVILGELAESKQEQRRVRALLRWYQKRRPRASSGAGRPQTPRFR